MPVRFINRVNEIEGAARELMATLSPHRTTKEKGVMRKLQHALELTVIKEPKPYSYVCAARRYPNGMTSCGRCGMEWPTEMKNLPCHPSIKS